MRKLRNLKVFEDFNERNASIDAICKQYKIKNYTINLDGSIDVDGDVNLFDMNLRKIPLQFNYISGNFDISSNDLDSLKGAPRNIDGDFYYVDNYFPNLINDNRRLIRYIIANQDDYGIWNKDGSFNEIRFKIMMKEKDI